MKKLLRESIKKHIREILEDYILEKIPGNKLRGISGRIPGSAEILGQILVSAFAARIF